MGYARFIPAGAGNTASSLPSVWPAPVYPRWRGEHSGEIRERVTFFGLSPLARGTRLLSRLRKGWRRFIPAGAGNTMRPDPARAGETVYPRWRGEHCIDWSIPAPSIGLSPLARGTLHRNVNGIRFNRFIPAGAGNTHSCESLQLTLSVYPRWRGEHGGFHVVTRRALGLSPLARGTPAFPISETHAQRFIPAGAGNTEPLTWFR